MKKGLQRFLTLFLVLCLIGTAFPSVSVLAAQKKQYNKWVKNSKGYYSYVKSNGKKATSLYTIKGKKYYFDAKGRQLSGWQKIKGNYYFFRQGKGSTAYMMTDTTVNEIGLGKNGKAILDTTRKQRKAVILCNAQTLVQSIITDKTTTRAEKLRILYNWTQKDANIVKSNIGGFHTWDANWDLYYAERAFGTGAVRPTRGDCYTYAAVFAYLANAIGYKATICSTGGHGYVCIDHEFYDPSWQKNVSEDLFAQAWNAVAPHHGAKYAAQMKYSKTV